MLTNTEAATRVSKGAAFLDKKWPEWFRYVEVNTLDMSDTCRCVLGQLDGDYNSAIDKFWPAPSNNLAHAMLGLASADAGLTAVDFGFDAPDCDFGAEEDADYKLLQDMWVAEIGERRYGRETTDGHTEARGIEEKSRGVAGAQASDAGFLPHG